MATTTGGFPIPEAVPTLRRRRSRVQGQVLEPGMAGYDEAREVWNRLIDRYPLLIVRAASIADIPPVLEAARETRLPLAVRGAGHSNAGLGTVDDGIAGMTLGGGVGWLVRSAGLALDRLVQVEVITADGKQLTASTTEHPELFWGLRDGGGNFGVATSFTFEAVPLPDPVLGATLFYRPEAWRRALAAFERWSRDLPDPLTSILTVMVMPGERGMGEEPWLLLRCPGGAPRWTSTTWAGPSLGCLRSPRPSPTAPRGSG